jgi:hypothetical protein
MQLALYQEKSAHAPGQVTLRFGTLLLACVLLSLNWGRSLSQDVANMCQVFGVCGLAFYFSLELVADQRAKQEMNTNTNTNFHLGDQRLSQRLLAEHMMAQIAEREQFQGTPALQHAAARLKSR